MTDGSPDQSVVVHPLAITQKPDQARWSGPLAGLVVAVLLYFGTHWLVTVIVGISTVVAIVVTLHAPKLEAQMGDLMAKMSLTLEGGELSYLGPNGASRHVATVGAGGRVLRVPIFPFGGSREDWKAPSVQWVWLDAAGRPTLRINEGAWPADELHALRKLVGLPISDGESFAQRLFGGRRPRNGSGGLPGGPSASNGPSAPSGPPTGGTSGPTLPGIPNG